MADPKQRVKDIRQQIRLKEAELDRLLQSTLQYRLLDDSGAKLDSRGPMPSEFHLPALLLPESRLRAAQRIKDQIAGLEEEYNKAMRDLSDFLLERMVPTVNPDITPLPDNRKIVRGEGDLPQWR